MNHFTSCSLSAHVIVGGEGWGEVGHFCSTHTIAITTTTSPQRGGYPARHCFAMGPALSPASGEEGI